jgi:hypothetical protein
LTPCSQKFNHRHNHRVALTDETRCPHPSLNAELIEVAAWRMVVNELLDPTHLREALDAARARAEEATGSVRDRLEAIDTALEREQRRLGRCVTRINSLDLAEVSDEDAEELAALEADREQIKKLLAGLRRERAEVEASHEPLSLSDTEVADLEAHAAKVREGLDATSAGERQRIFELLKLHGTVMPGSDITVSMKPLRMIAVAWSGVLWQGVNSRTG